MFFDGIKPKEYSLNEEKFPINNYSNALSFLINENNIVNESLLFDIHPLMEEAILFEDDLMLSESIADGLALSISSLKKTINKIDELWKNFVMDHESNRKDAAELVTKALINKSPEGYTYYGYTYHIKYDNIYIDHSLVNSTNLVARQLTNERVEQLRNHYESPQYYDKIRGQFISKPICNADDFPRELKMYYRNNKSTPSEIPMNDDLKEKMIDSLFNIDETVENCKSIKDSILAYCKAALQYLEKMHQLTQIKKNGLLDSRAIGFKLSDIEELANVQIKNIRTMISIYITVLTIKMDMSNERQRAYTRTLKEISEGGEK